MALRCEALPAGHPLPRALTVPLGPFQWPPSFVRRTCQEDLPALKSRMDANDLAATTMEELRERSGLCFTGSGPGFKLLGLLGV